MKKSPTPECFRLRSQVGWHFLGVSALSVGLILARTVVTGHPRQLFLVWNLTLAWVPLLLACAASWLHTAQPARRGWFALVAIAWLCFRRTRRIS